MNEGRRRVDGTGLTGNEKVKQKGNQTDPVGLKVISSFFFYPSFTLSSLPYIIVIVTLQEGVNVVWVFVFFSFFLSSTLSSHRYFPFPSSTYLLIL
jgi:hypothetical protein